MVVHGFFVCFYFITMLSFITRNMTAITSLKHQGCMNIQVEFRILIVSHLLWKLPINDSKRIHLGGAKHMIYDT